MTYSRWSVDTEVLGEGVVGVGPEKGQYHNWVILVPCELPQTGFKSYVPVHCEYSPKIPKDMHTYKPTYYIYIYYELL